MVTYILSFPFTGIYHVMCKVAGSCDVPYSSDIFMPGTSPTDICVM